MPPEKPATSSVGEYEVELMTEQELRQYVEALQEEQQRLRKARNLHQRDKNELLHILKFTQENIFDKGRSEIQNGFEVHELIVQTERESRLEDALNKITELENKHEGEKNALESFIKVKTIEISNKEEEDALLKAIAERDREIQNMEHVLKQTLIQSKENLLEKCHKSGKIRKSNFEKIVNIYNENFIKLLEEFSKSKIEKLQGIWADIPDAEYKPFANTVAEMTTYFKDIYWKNIRTIAELQCSLRDIKKELNIISQNLRDITKDNNELRAYKYERLSPRCSLLSTSSFSAVKAKNLEELTYENYLLTLKLEMLNKEFSDLKEKFVSALRSIYQKTEFKALVLAKILSAVQSLSRCSH